MGSRERECIDANRRTSAPSQWVYEARPANKYAPRTEVADRYEIIQSQPDRSKALRQFHNGVTEYSRVRTRRYHNPNGMLGGHSSTLIASLTENASRRLEKCCKMSVAVSLRESGSTNSKQESLWLQPTNLVPRGFKAKRALSTVDRVTSSDDCHEG